MGEHEAEIKKIKNAFLAILRNIKKEMDSVERPGERVTSAMFQTMWDALAEQRREPLSMDDVTAMIARQIGQILSMYEEISKRFQTLKKDDGTGEQYTKRGKTMSDVMIPEQRSRAMCNIVK